MAYVYLDAPGEPDGERTAWERPIPLEYVVSLQVLSERIRFPPGEVPWAERFRDPRRLVVLEAERGRACLLDYREAESPAVLLVDDLAAGDSPSHVRVDSVDEFLRRLRRLKSPG